MLRCAHCGTGLDSWVQNGASVYQCSGCEVRVVIASNELDDWLEVRDNSFTNHDVLEDGNDA
jgi:DNA-directed RNA polymerase subunit RPC12/RpoP